MTHDFRRSADMITGFDTDRSFMLIEISGDKLYFQVISRTGTTIDSGMLQEQPPVSK